MNNIFHLKGKIRNYLSASTLRKSLSPFSLTNLLSTTTSTTTTTNRGLAQQFPSSPDGHFNIRNIAFKGTDGHVHYQHNNITYSTTNKEPYVTAENIHQSTTKWKSTEFVVASKFDVARCTSTTPPPTPTSPLKTPPSIDTPNTSNTSTSSRKHGNPSVHSKQIEITFFGTGSMIPTASRGTSSLALRLDGEIWMFDCGEGTQTKAQSTQVSLNDISKIFITHLHGDHIFGLPGILCGMAQTKKAAVLDKIKDGSRKKPTEGDTVEIYGPVGLRSYLRMAATISYAKFPPYVVHELEDIPYVSPNGKESYRNRNNREHTRCDANKPAKSHGECHGGTQIWKQKDEQDGQEYWTCVDRESDGMYVRAGALSHTIPTVGYVVEEPETIGKIQPDKLVPVIQRNSKQIQKEGLTFPNGERKILKHPMSLISAIKSADPNDVFTMPDGISFTSKDFKESNVQGKKIGILGDSAYSAKLLHLVQDADVLIHECTNVAIPDSGDNERDMERQLKARGHSSPRMAGNFAKQANVKQLILNHFSQALFPSDINYIRSQASKISGLGIGQVITARDGLAVDINKTSIQNTDGKKETNRERKLREGYKLVNGKFVHPDAWGDHHSIFFDQK